MKLYDVWLAHWFDGWVLHHRIRYFCRHLWCWHSMCGGAIPFDRCGYCGRGARP